ncbi:MAG: TIGR00269 family protein [Candidatus Nanohalobium sp.]
MTSSENCTKCGEEAVITREYEGRSLCKKHFSVDVNKTVKSTIRKGEMVESGDIIAVGLSGGKDSAVMLQQLVEIFGDRPDIEIKGLAVHEGIDGYRDESIRAAEKLCDNLGVKLHVARYSDYYDLEMDEVVKKDIERSNCTYCGVLRRDLLNKKSREIEANKLAVGHNKDDEAQALLMNYIKGDMMRLARIGSKLVNDNDFVPRIKPLRDLREKEIALYSRLHNLGVVDRCPHVQEGSLRPRVKKFLNDLEEEMPGIKDQVVANGREISDLVEDEYSFEDSDLSPCEKCGEPSSNEVCRKCQLLEELQNM